MFQLQAHPGQRKARLNDAMAAVGPGALANNPLPWHRPIRGDRDPEETHGKLMNILLGSSPETIR